KSCQHALCNAHHLRELERAWEQDNQAWARLLQNLLKEMNRTVLEQNGSVSQKVRCQYIERYRAILEAGDEESPPPDESQRKEGQRGRLKRSKSRALLERLRAYEDDVLRFLNVSEVPFTNNQGENDIR
ncbi:IS66 family transposase, partial [Oceanospirillum sediminis]